MNDVPYIVVRHSNFDKRVLPQVVDSSKRAIPRHKWREDSRFAVAAHNLYGIRYEADGIVFLNILDLIDPQHQFSLPSKYVCMKGQVIDWNVEASLKI